MNDLSVIDRFLATFIRYIDSGFGLLNGDVAFLTSILIGVDIVLAGLFWALEPEGNLFGRLIRKVLYVGFFAFIQNNFASLADIIYRSFAGLGLHASANRLAPDDLLKPGRVASTGFDAAWPLLHQVGQMMGFTSFFENFLPIMVLLIAWLIVIIAFFILAVQLFITVLEFKLTTLAGFVLVPFALWNKTAFLAERVLGNVIAAGIKVMVLAVIVGIGSSFFAEFLTALNGKEPDIGQAMSLVLASLALFGLGIFGPGIAAGLVSGAPQLGAGTVIGTAGAAAATAMITGGLVAGGGRALAHAGAGGLAAIRAGTSLGGGDAAAKAGPSPAAAASSGRPSGGQPASAPGAASGAASRAAPASGPTPSASSADAGAASASSSSPDKPPPWAQRMRAEQMAREQRRAAAQTLRDGDRPGAGASPDLKQKED
ncbi:MAG: P-type conjugative transfer protein TrbL [Azospirillum sp.]|nr:P-type conjugative transfer protein TrbL [Azospirillum sp.]